MPVLRARPGEGQQFLHEPRDLTHLILKVIDSAGLRPVFQYPQSKLNARDRSTEFMRNVAEETLLSRGIADPRDRERQAANERQPAKHEDNGYRAGHCERGL
jgi:hypothetical protein